MVKRAVGGAIHLDSQNHISVCGLRNISFEVNAGDRIALVGHNGAGKSVLLRTLAGIYRPTLGHVASEGTINTLFDISFGFDPDLSGRRNLYRRAYILGLRRQQIDSMLEEITNFSELGDYLDMPLRTYSAGMALRLAFTISTCIRSEILLMDEWLGVGDANFMNKAQARLLDLTEKSEIFVLASHSQELLRRVCTKAIFLRGGELVAFGPLEDVLKEYNKEPTPRS